MALCATLPLPVHHARSLYDTCVSRVARADRGAADTVRLDAGSSCIAAATLDDIARSRDLLDLRHAERLRQRARPAHCRASDGWRTCVRGVVGRRVSVADYAYEASATAWAAKSDVRGRVTSVAHSHATGHVLLATDCNSVMILHAADRCAACAGTATRVLATCGACVSGVGVIEERRLALVLLSDGRILTLPLEDGGGAVRSRSECNDTSCCRASMPPTTATTARTHAAADLEAAGARVHGPYAGLAGRDLVSLRVVGACIVAAYPDRASVLHLNALVHATAPVVRVLRLASDSRDCALAAYTLRGAHVAPHCGTVVAWVRHRATPIDAICWRSGSGGNGGSADDSGWCGEELNDTLLALELLDAVDASGAPTLVALPRVRRVPVLMHIGAGGLGEPRALLADTVWQRLYAEARLDVFAGTGGESALVMRVCGSTVVLHSRTIRGRGALVVVSATTHRARCLPVGEPRVHTYVTSVFLHATSLCIAVDLRDSDGRGRRRRQITVLEFDGGGGSSNDSGRRRC